MLDCLSGSRFLVFANDSTDGNRKIRTKPIDAAHFFEVVMTELPKYQVNTWVSINVSICQSGGRTCRVRLWQIQHDDHDTLAVHTGQSRSSCQKCPFGLKHHSIGYPKERSNAHAL